MSTPDDFITAMNEVADSAHVAAESFGRMRRTGKEMHERLQAYAAREREIREHDQQALWKGWR